MLDQDIAHCERHRTAVQLADVRAAAGGGVVFPLRDPVDRLVSAFGHLRRQREDAIARGLKHIDPAYARPLLGCFENATQLARALADVDDDVNASEARDCGSLAAGASCEHGALEHTDAPRGERLSCRLLAEHALEPARDFGLNHIQFGYMWYVGEPAVQAAMLNRSRTDVFVVRLPSIDEDLRELVAWSRAGGRLPPSRGSDDLSQLGPAPHISHGSTHPPLDYLPEPRLVRALARRLTHEYEMVARLLCASVNGVRALPLVFGRMRLRGCSPTVPPGEAYADWRLIIDEP